MMKVLQEFEMPCIVFYGFIVNVTEIFVNVL